RAHEGGADRRRDGGLGEAPVLPSSQVGGTGERGGKRRAAPEQGTGHLHKGIPALALGPVHTCRAPAQQASTFSHLAGVKYLIASFHDFSPSPVVGRLLPFSAGPSGCRGPIFHGLRVPWGSGPRSVLHG